MKRIINQTGVLAITIMVMLLAACNKKIDLSPTDAIDASKAFQSISDLRAGMYGAYAANSRASKIYYGSLLADEVKLSDENRGQGQSEFKWQYSSATGDMGGMGAYYTLIDRVHRVLAAADGIPGANAADENFKKQMKAELTALRGVAYLELLTSFMSAGYDPNSLGVAIILESNLLAKLPRNTVGQVMTQIEADLAVGRAEALIPTAPSDPLRLSQAAIAGYQARAALLRKDYDKAIAFASEAITLSGKTLSRSQFMSYWTDDNESESLFKYRNGSTPQLNWRDTNGDVFFEPADKLKMLYDRVNDIRFSTFFTSDGGDSSIIVKYPGSSRGPQINDIKLMRLAEMYLIRAEAYAEKDQLAQAAADINALRAARISGYTNISFASKAEAIDQILIERMKELCFEGFRFFDLKRRSLPVQRLLVDARNANWQTLPANDFRFALPIPTDEIFANPNIQQNPGY